MKIRFLLVACVFSLGACGGGDFEKACDKWRSGSDKSYGARAEFASQMAELTDGRLSEDFKFLERTLRALSAGDVNRAESYELQTKISERRINERMSECLK
jgi:hypothetical protein